MDKHDRVIPAYRSDTLALDETDILSWVHFGDLHITTETAKTYGDFLALISNANRHLKGGIAFAVLPDNAENGTEADLRDHALDGTNWRLWHLYCDRPRQNAFNVEPAFISGSRLKSTGVKHHERHLRARA